MKNKNPINEAPATGGEAPQHAKEISHVEIERRLAALEKTTHDLSVRIFDSHKWFVTVLFSAVAVVLTVYGVLSRLDVRDSTNEMEKRVNSATSDMEKRFQALAGEAFKKPVIEILNQDTALENKVIDIYAQAGVLPVSASLTTLFIRNIGDKKSEPLSVRISLAAPVALSDYRSASWETSASFETNFVSCFYLKRHDTVAPGETLNIQELPLDWRSVSTNPTDVGCKIQVFFGGDKPSEAQFQVRVHLR